MSFIELSCIVGNKLVCNSCITKTTQISYVEFLEAEGNYNFNFDYYEYFTSWVIPH